jgi:hypothetical protein
LLLFTEKGLLNRAALSVAGNLAQLDEIKRARMKPIDGFCHLLLRIEVAMNAWLCASLICAAGGVGGIVNALLTDNGFILPTRVHEIWCPGFLSNLFIGAFSAFASWSFYGSGAAIDLADLSTRAQISLRFSALAGAFMVGVAGARWITNEVDKTLLKASVKVAAKKDFSQQDCDGILNKPPKEVLESLANA